MMNQKKIADKVIYLNVTEIRKNDAQWNLFKNKYKISYTPTLAKFKDGEQISIVQWTPEKGTVLAEFDKSLDENIERW